jgi:nucleotide-binding universal stress UspA family protein
MFERVLVAVDLEDQAVAAKVVAAAAQVAKPGAEIRLVHVRYAIEASLRHVSKETRAVGEAEALAELRTLADKVATPAAKWSFTSPAGSPHDRALAEAEGFQADLIVIGPHRRSMAKALLGASATAIVKNAKASVLVVR